MKYLIVQDWPATHGNHAGMAHMCSLLKQLHPNEYEVFVKDFPKSFSVSNSFFLRLFSSFRHKVYMKHAYKKEYISFLSPLFSKLKQKDEIYLLEYCLPNASQLCVAMYIKKNFPDVRVYALSHLTPSYFPKPTMYPTMIKKWSKYVDKMLTLGSSLSSYLVECGCEPDKVVTGFHYVDSKYYKRSNGFIEHDKLTVIAIGAMQRNMNLISDIVKSIPNVNWIICCGRKKVEHLFQGCQNVTLKGYIEEEELKKCMEDSDISINVMEDTVGSNVITTSLSMGLAMVCSDVGSIRDYCDNHNTEFCENTVKSFVHAINKLDKDRDRVASLKKHSLERSKKYQIENFHEFLCSLNHI